ncbi:TonB-dependent receptor [Prevotella disiens]|uniref:TonB-dependent receptor n=1 Tax=Prevotella disiens TaxID=28130 RepID=UPI00336ACE03
MTFFACLFFVQMQAQMQCKVLEKGTRTPIIGATVMVVGTKKIIAVTDQNGCFVLSDGFNKTIKISYIGYKPLQIIPKKAGVYYLSPNINSLQEVVVTAQEGHGLSSASTISRQAMEHLQPSSFADLLELLPGGRAHDPHLNVPNTINLREVPIGNDQYNTTSLGTRFVIDGAPVSVNGNMQYLSGAIDRTSGKRNFANAGVDMRTLSTDDIQEVTIIRGIPSVQYGDLTSGLVKVKRRKGGNDISARFKADMDTKLFYLSKAFEWQEKKFSLNLSADYLNNKAEPRNLLETYQRITISARLNKRWHTKPLNFNSSFNLDYGGSFDNDKKDPQFNHGGIDKYKSKYNRYAASWAFDMNSNSDRSIFKSAELSASFSYEKNLLERTRLVQLDGDTPAAMTMTEGESDAVLITPYKYTATHTVDGKPISLFLKANATFSAPIKGLSNTLLTGIDYQMDRNLGEGQIYDRLHPVYTGASFRPRRYADIPASQMLAAYAEERLSMGIGSNKLDIEAGVRAETMPGIDKRFATYRKVNIDPRINAGWTFPSFKVGKDRMTINLTGGIGWHSMFPTIDLLYPEPAYMDIVELNYYHEKPEYRRMYLQTYVIDPTNPDLKAARNLKWEVKGDIDWAGNRLTMTYFVEDMKSGFRSMSVYAPYQYKEYDPSGIDPDALSDRPDIHTLPYKIKNVMRYYEHSSNGSRTYKRGLEWILSTVRFPVINTRLTISGAWFLTEYHNSLPIMYKPTKMIGGEPMEIVGIYKDDEGFIREMVNTNFTFDTTIPKLKLGFSLSAQCIWQTAEQSMYKENIPLKYMDVNGNIHPFTEADTHDLYLQHLVRTYTDGMFLRQTVPFSMDLNFKATKKLFNDKLMVALFVNKMWDAHPDYERNNFVIRRYVTPYFGLEMNVKL